MSLTNDITAIRKVLKDYQNNGLTKEPTIPTQAAIQATHKVMRSITKGYGDRGPWKLELVSVQDKGITLTFTVYPNLRYTYTINAKGTIDKSTSTIKTALKPQKP